VGRSKTPEAAPKKEGKCWERIFEQSENLLKQPEGTKVFAHFSKKPFNREREGVAKREVKSNPRTVTVMGKKDKQRKLGFKSNKKNLFIRSTVGTHGTELRERNLGLLNCSQKELPGLEFGYSRRGRPNSSLGNDGQKKGIKK